MIDDDESEELTAEMIAAIVPCDRRTFSEDEIDDLTGVWARLLAHVDYYKRHWYSPDENGDWQQISFGNVPALLESLGVDDVVTVMRQFRDRNRHLPLPKRVVSEAQLQLGM